MCSNDINRGRPAARTAASGWVSRSCGTVELHGGTITAHSAGRGQGATFVVELPTTLVRPAPAPSHAELV